MLARGRELGAKTIIFICVGLAFEFSYLVLSQCLVVLDTVDGILLGAGFVQLVRLPAVHVSLRRNVELFYAKRPALFITLFFLWSFEAAVLFTGVRKALYFLVLHY